MRKPYHSSPFVKAGNVVVLVEKNPHIRNNRDGTVIKLDVNNGCVHHGYVHGHVGVSQRNWFRFQLARTVSGSSVTNKLVRPRTKCSNESEKSFAEQELNGTEGEDAMTDEEGDGVEGEGKAGTADWRVRAGPGNKPTGRERKEH